MGYSKETFSKLTTIFKLRDFFMKPALWPVENIPLTGKLFGLLPKPPKTKLVQLTYLPVSEKVEVPDGIAIPVTIMENFIKEASYHVLLDHCMCRATKGCNDYPIELGCIFMGEGAREINPDYSRHVGVEETLDHFHKAVAAGLTPALGRFVGDAMALGVKSHGKMMTVCNCCPCCCITQYLHDIPDQVKGMTSRALVRLEGVTVKVNENCSGCGICEKNCQFGMIHVVDKKAVVSDYCTGCSRCSMVCPNEAIDIKIDNPEYINEAMNRIRSLFPAPL